MTNTGQPTMETNKFPTKEELNFEDYIGLTWSIIFKQRMKDIIDDDDLFQELSLVWLKCKQLYDPKKGVQFVSYYYTSAVNKVINIKERYNNEAYLWSLDYNISLTPKYDLPISDLYVDEEQNIERSYINEEIIYRFLTHPHGALAKYLLQGKSITYAADALEVDRSVASRWLKSMIEDVRKTQFEKSVL